MNFEPVIGLEIHVELKTRSKMFSAAPVTYGARPNSAVALLDLAFPGTLPRINEQAVIDGIMVAGALHMKIARELSFDRKNYFYSDLPKGYQISQARNPLGRDGWLMIDAGKGPRKIRIHDLHLEEDTCMQHHYADCTLLDYNRAGVPLLEIVSEPEIKTGLEAMRYVEKIRSIVVYSGVSDGKMEEGSLRCDVNVSLKEEGSGVLGTKVEIKNLNSISYIQKALDYEIERQKSLLFAGKEIRQETRRYDEAEKKTVLMRVKTNAVDYKYFPEENLLPVELSEDFIRKAIASCPELAEAKKARYMRDYGLSDYDASLLTNDKDVSVYFDEAARLTKHHKLLANWLNVDVPGYLNRRGLKIKDFPLSPKELASLIALIGDGLISVSQARQVFLKMAEDGMDAPAAMKALGIEAQVSDEALISKYVDEVMKEFPESVRDYRAGKGRALSFLVGQIMKKSRGKVNPRLTSELLMKALGKRS